jgi:GT2 family glycosyltransferase
MVCIVILNWNLWRDTVECLESVFRLEYDDFQVILCDNDSTDGSVEQIRAWADAKLPHVHISLFLCYERYLQAKQNALFC